MLEPWSASVELDYGFGSHDGQIQVRGLQLVVDGDRRLVMGDHRFRAYIHGSPTVVDMDGDGRVEVIVGTSMGLLYVLDGDTGFVRRHFPMQFYEIESQVAVADVNGDGHIEMIVADMRGNLAVVSIDGAILWDIQLPSLDVNTYNSIPYTPTLGDVNGDGFMDIAVVTVERPIGDLAEAQGRGDAARRSALWVIDAKTGAVLPSYPIALPKGAVVTSPVVLVDLHDNRCDVLSSSELLIPHRTCWQWCGSASSHGAHGPEASPVDAAHRGPRSSAGTRILCATT